jgi:hypothetical protein
MEIFAGFQKNGRSVKLQIRQRESIVQGISQNATASEESDTDIKVSFRPVGGNKARSLEAVAAKAEQWFDEN